MRAVVILLIAAVPASALAQDFLPNANLPGNSPSLPNSNMPGSLPDDNPVNLPNSDTTPSVILPTQRYLYQLGSNLPQRNPTIPPTPEELAELDLEAQARLAATEAEARAIRDEAAARENAAAAREDLAAGREDTAAARENTAAVREDAATARENQPPEQPQTTP